MLINKSIPLPPPPPSALIVWLLLPLFGKFLLIFASEDFPNFLKSSRSLSNISWRFVLESFQGIYSTTVWKQKLDVTIKGI